MSLDKAASLVKQLATLDPGLAHRRAYEVSSMIGRAELLSDILASIERDPSRLSRIARQSFHHTNHFDKIVLLGNRAGSSYRLTLHLWQPPYTLQEIENEHIHNHRNDFWSTVLFGQLKSEEYVRYETGDRYWETLYRPAEAQSGKKANEYEPLGTAQLQRNVVRRWNAGATYFLHHETIHRINISQVATATLLLKGPHVSETSSLFSREPWWARRLELEPLTPRLLLERFHFIRRNLC